MKLELEPQASPIDWDGFVNGHPHGTLFHDSSWHRIMERTYGFRPLYFLARDESGNIRSGIAAALVRNLFQGRKLCSYPFSDHCDPLLGDPKDFAPLLESMNAFARQNADASLEIRCFRTDPDKMQPHESKVTERGTQNLEPRTRNAECGTNFILPLTAAPEQLFKNFHRSCIQRPIRKAEREGVTVRKGEDETDLKQYFRLHLLTRRRLGIPSQPFSFFRNLWLEFAPTRRLTLLLAEHEGQPAAGMLLLHHGAATVYKFGASSEEKMSLGVNPLLFWRAIQLAIRRGDRELDLGRTEKEEVGLYDFKIRLGAEAVPLRYISSAEPRPTAGSGMPLRLLRSGLRRLPSAGLRTGGFLYRYLA
ncbi:MAG TPA: GNAT family N-acetyltransferase [Acidobacteriota bacterium]|nr:GNAT family N-acetyltransferase [Acidobacteriota bacterium]